MSSINKYFKHLVIANIIIIVVVGLILGVPGDCIPFWIAIIVLNSIFFVFATGWRRWASLGFVVLGLFLLKGEIVAKNAWKEKHEKLLQQINSKWGGASGATNSSIKTNSTADTTLTN